MELIRTELTTEALSSTLIDRATILSRMVNNHNRVGNHCDAFGPPQYACLCSSCGSIPSFHCFFSPGINLFAIRAVFQFLQLSFNNNFPFSHFSLTFKRQQCLICFVPQWLSSLLQESKPHVFSKSNILAYCHQLFFIIVICSFVLIKWIRLQANISNVYGLSNTKSDQSNSRALPVLWPRLNEIK